MHEDNDMLRGFDMVGGSADPSAKAARTPGTELTINQAAGEQCSRGVLNAVVSASLSACQCARLRALRCRTHPVAICCMCNARHATYISTCWVGTAQGFSIALTTHHVPSSTLAVGVIYNNSPLNSAMAAVAAAKPAAQWPAFTTVTFQSYLDRVRDRAAPP